MLSIMEEVARDNKIKSFFSQKGSISLSIIGLGVLLFSAVVLPLASKLVQQRVTTQQKAYEINCNFDFGNLRNITKGTSGLSVQYEINDLVEADLVLVGNPFNPILLSGEYLKEASPVFNYCSEMIRIESITSILKDSFGASIQGITTANFQDLGGKVRLGLVFNSSHNSYSIEFAKIRFKIIGPGQCGIKFTTESLLKSSNNNLALVDTTTIQLGFDIKPDPAVPAPTNTSAPVATATSTPRPTATSTPTRLAATATPRPTNTPAPATEQVKVALVPSSTSVAMGQTTTLDIQVQNVTGLYGAEVRLSFDQTRLQVQDALVYQTGVQIQPGTFPDPVNGFVAANTADNASGTIIYTMTLLTPAQPVSGNGTLARIVFQGVAPGSATTIFTSVTLLDNLTQPIPASSQNAAITVTATATATPRPQPTATSTPAPIPCQGGGKWCEDKTDCTNVSYGTWTEDYGWCQPDNLVCCTPPGGSGGDNAACLNVRSGRAGQVIIEPQATSVIKGGKVNIKVTQKPYRWKLHDTCYYAFIDIYVKTGSKTGVVCRAGGESSPESFRTMGLTTAEAAAHGKIRSCEWDTASWPAGIYVLEAYYGGHTDIDQLLQPGCCDTEDWGQASMTVVSPPTNTPTPPPATSTPTPDCSRRIYGDANCNGVIDIVDFGIWRDEYLGDSTGKTADFNADNKIDLKDFGIWRKNAQ